MDNVDKIIPPRTPPTRAIHTEPPKPEPPHHEPENSESITEQTHHEPENSESKTEQIHHQPANTQHDVSHGRTLIVPIIPKQYAMQLAPLLLCGTSSWAVNRTSYELDCTAFATFVLMLGRSLSGMLKETMNDEDKNKIEKYYVYIDFLAKILPLPLINMQIYFNYDHHSIVSYSHGVSSLIPIAYNVVYNEWIVEEQTNSKTAIAKIVNFSNICSLGVIGVVNENYWAIGLSVLSLINELVLDFVEENNNAVALAFFNILAIQALESV